MTGDDPLVLVGKIVGVHGMKGNLKVNGFDAPMGLFDPGRTLRIQRPGAGMRTARIRSVEAHRNILRLSFHEISDRTAAEDVVGSEVYVRRSEMPEPEPGTWYWGDLIGLSVVRTDGVYVGRVENLFETAAHDVLVVKNGDAEVLVPVAAAIVRNVDFAEKKIHVDLPEGLMD